MADIDIITKRAITYSVLAHISSSTKLAQGQLDIFIPVVKKSLQHLSEGSVETKGENISEIADQVTKDWQIDLPLPVLRTILIQISKEFVAENDFNVFTFNNDGSYWIKNYVFADFDEHIRNSEHKVKELQKAYKQFCKINNVPTSDGCDVIRFIDQHKDSLAHYISHSNNQDKTDYSIPARFIEYFRSITPLYEEIRDLYLGATMCCAIGYQFEGLKNDVTLLLDTNFIISLLDLNTPESTKTCSMLLDICSKSGYTFVILPETVEEIQGLLEYKANNLDKVSISKYVNKEDVFCACERRKLNGADLMRISDNLSTHLDKFGISVIPNSTSWRNKARFSNEYSVLKSYRSSDKAALHDAMAIIFVKEKRGKAIKAFEKVNCWFVNNSITHDFEHDAIENIITENSSEQQPEIIKADDLLNILWLSTPSIRNSVASEKMVDMGLTTLVAHTLNKSLPKARIVRELDENIQKYRSEDITDRDIYLLSVRIANNQIKNVGAINELASNNSAEFNSRVKDEARRQEAIENERQAQLDALYTELHKAIDNISKQSEIQAKQAKDIQIKIETSNHKEKELEDKLEHSEKEITDLADNIQGKDLTIKRQKRIIYSLICLIVGCAIFMISKYLPIIAWLKEIIKGVGGLGGVWGFLSLCFNIFKAFILKK